MNGKCKLSEQNLSEMYGRQCGELILDLESERIKVSTELTHFRNRVVHFLEVIHGCVIIVVLSSAFVAQHAEKLGTVASGNFLSSLAI